MRAIHWLFAILAVLAIDWTAAAEDAPAVPSERVPGERERGERVFSGPQVGEILPAFTVRGAFDAEAGKDLDFVAAAGKKPIVLIFVHDANRPSIALTRALSKYAVGRAPDGVTTGVVWLDDDATEAENKLKRMRHALYAGTPTGISLDGREGPGSYGLNRGVTLTILVGDAGRVTANFALVQPSIQSDLPQILAAIVRVAGGQIPKIEELVGEAAMARPRGELANDNLRALLRPVIAKDATDASVERAAAAVEEFAAKDAAARKRIAEIAKTIIDSGKLADYGTPRAQEFLRKWKADFAEPAPEKSPSTPP